MADDYKDPLPTEKLIEALEETWKHVRDVSAGLGQPRLLGEPGAAVHIATAKVHLVQAMNELNAAHTFLLGFKKPSASGAEAGD